jgi:hypothetical protein
MSDEDVDGAAPRTSTAIERDNCQRPELAKGICGMWCIEPSSPMEKRAGTQRETRWGRSDSDRGWWPGPPRE